MTPLVTLTAAQLQATAGEPEPRRPRKYPANRSMPQLKVQPPDAATLERWNAAAKAAGMKRSTWIARAATRAAEEQLGPATPDPAP